MGSAYGLNKSTTGQFRSHVEGEVPCSLRTTAGAILDRYGTLVVVSPYRAIEDEQRELFGLDPQQQLVADMEAHVLGHQWSECGVKFERASRPSDDTLPLARDVHDLVVLPGLLQFLLHSDK